MPSQEQDKQLSKRQWFMLGTLGLLVLGLGLTFIPSRKSETKADVHNQVSQVSVQKEELTYEELLENKLENILEKMDGAGKVEVMVTTKGSKEKILAVENVQDSMNMQEVDSSGGTRTQTQQNASNKVVLEAGKAPYVIKENRPEIEGVLVLAEGGDKPQTQKGILDAVASLLNVPKNKITIFKMGKN